LTDAELGEEAGVAFNRAEAAIASADWIPIDFTD